METHETRHVSRYVRYHDLAGANLIGDRLHCCLTEDVRIGQGWFFVRALDRILINQFNFIFILTCQSRCIPLTH